MKLNKIRFFLLITLFPLLLNLSIFSENFQFKYKEGTSSRILSTVQEDVYVNNYFNHHAEIVNRISVEITGVVQEADGSVSGNHHAIFMTTENSTGATNTQFVWGEEYTSDFLRTSLGKYTIDDSFFMPVVRDVPIFTGKDVQIGETWTAEGHEAYDLRQTFGVETPYKVPFSARYQYTGTVQDGETTLHIITAQYSLYYDSPKPQNSTIEDYPATTMGFSNQTVYWDNERGCIDHYTENFRIVIETAYGNVYEFRGNAGAEVTEYAEVDNTDSIEKVRQQIADLGIENTSVTEDEKGITISIENIQFLADSAVLTKTEQKKLDDIIKILQAFPDNDLLVTGHTALAGRAETRQRLSEERAQAVAGYLIESGVKDAYHIFTRGYGADKPIASNDTEAGKARNRRVEITILEK